MRLFIKSEKEENKLTDILDHKQMTSSVYIL